MITVTEQVIAELRERILDGKFAPGEHLHEAEMASILNVSRTPIRDAMRVLANEELLVYYPNRGYIVRNVDLQDVLDAYDVRGTLEGMACRSLAQRGLTAPERTRFSNILDSSERIFQAAQWGAEEQAAWRAANTEFHLAVLEAAGNRHLGPILHQMRFFPRIFDNRLVPESEFFQKVHTRDQRLRSHHEHVKIVEAMLQRDGARVEALMREHVHANREVLRRGLEHGEAGSGPASAADGEKRRKVAKGK